MKNICKCSTKTQFKACNNSSISIRGSFSLSGAAGPHDRVLTMSSTTVTVVLHWNQKQEQMLDLKKQKKNEINQQLTYRFNWLSWSKPPPAPPAPLHLLHRSIHCIPNSGPHSELCGGATDVAIWLNIRRFRMICHFVMKKSTRILVVVYGIIYLPR